MRLGFPCHTEPFIRLAVHRLSGALLFFVVGYAIFKDFSCPFGSKFTGRTILPVTSWQLTNRTVSYISRRSGHSICQSFFFCVNLWYDSNPFRRNNLSRPWDFSLARSLRDLVHWSSLRSLLRTYEKSTCSKSKPFKVPSEQSKMNGPV